MSIYSVWAACLSYFCPHVDWSEAPDSIPADSDDETAVKAYRSHNGEHAFLFFDRDGGFVRLLFGAWLDSPPGDSDSMALFDLLETQNEWFWLSDECRIDMPSALIHAESGAIVFIIDLPLQEPFESEEGARKELGDWLDHCRELKAQLHASKLIDE